MLRPLPGSSGKAAAVIANALSLGYDFTIPAKESFGARSVRVARVIFPEFLLNEAITWCRRNLPAEACGLLGGWVQTGEVRPGSESDQEADGMAGIAEVVVGKVYPIENIEREARGTRYFLDPRGQLAAIKDAERAGMEIVGAFHSHVASPARPSQLDIELAQYPEWVWMIVSMRDSERPEVGVFSIVDGTVERIDLIVR